MLSASATASGALQNKKNVGPPIPVKPLLATRAFAKCLIPETDQQVTKQASSTCHGSSLLSSCWLATSEQLLPHLQPQLTSQMDI